MRIRKSKLIFSLLRQMPCYLICVLEECAPYLARTMRNICHWPMKSFPNLKCCFRKIMKIHFILGSQADFQTAKVLITSFAFNLHLAPIRTHILFLNSPSALNRKWELHTVRASCSSLYVLRIVNFRSLFGKQTDSMLLFAGSEWKTNPDFSTQFRWKQQLELLFIHSPLRPLRKCATVVTVAANGDDGEIQSLIYGLKKANGINIRGYQTLKFKYSFN